MLLFLRDKHLTHNHSPVPQLAHLSLMYMSFCFHCLFLLKGFKYPNYIFLRKCQSFFFPWAGVEKQNPTFYLKHQVLSTWVWMIRTAASWLGLALVTSRVGLCQTKIDVKVGRVIASWEKSNRAVYYKPAREIPEDIRPTLDALGNGNRAKPSHAAFPQHPGPPTPGLFSGWASSFTPDTAGEAAWWTCYSYPSRCRWAAYAEMAIKPSNVCRQTRPSCQD